MTNTLRAVLSAIAALALLPTTPKAWVVSGDQLLRWCTDKMPPLPDPGTSPSARQLNRDMEMTNQLITGSYGGGCYGYIGGVADAYDGRRFCIPSGTTVDQFEDVAIRYLGRYQAAALRSTNAAEIVSEALYRAFPCR